MEARTVGGAPVYLDPSFRIYGGFDLGAYEDFAISHIGRVFGTGAPFHFTTGLIKKKPLGVRVLENY
ncbi:hypothetical protein Pla163_11050 [Planctomycetes bacterium Pla163]|uniref:Uncharacterized protein n=1 Tax=Rohdeia mirabilis TaxID=2528008 RepID=A0A518CXQ3_9BACT|nr:hypothetical protein Pla163_11050 [Planctomycetes bacterium Pla163]